MSSERPSKFKKTEQAIFQRPDVQFDTHFPSFAPAQISCSLESVADANEFDQSDANLFEFHELYTQLFPNALTTLSFAAKLATAIALSDKWLFSVGEVITETHTTPGIGGISIASCCENDVDRMRGLIKGGFRVVLDESDLATGYGAYDRGVFTSDSRRVELNAKFIREIQICAEDQSIDSSTKKDTLRRYAVLVAVTLVRECGGDALHTMVRPDYFFNVPGSCLDVNVQPKIDALTGQQRISPPRIFSHQFPTMIMTNDFGTACVLSYFRGAVPGMDRVDPNNGERSFQMKDLILNFKSVGFKVTVSTVASKYFQRATYEGDADGLFHREIDDTLPAVRDISKQITQNILSSSSGGARWKGAEALCALTAGVQLTVSPEHVGRSLDAELLGLAAVQPTEMLSGCGRSSATKRH